jgi:hypothetical protein
MVLGMPVGRAPLRRRVAWGRLALRWSLLLTLIDREAPDSLRQAALRWLDEDRRAGTHPAAAASRRSLVGG